MNVLKRIIIPKLEQTIHYIKAELEELEREDTFRLKRVKQNNMKRAKRRAEQNGAGEIIEVIDPTEKEDILKTTSVAKSEAVEKPDKDKDKESENGDKEDKESKPVQPKEAAEMGDLIVIKPADDTLIMGEALGPQTDLKDIVSFTETEKLIDESQFDEKEKNEIEKIPKEETRVNYDVVNDDFEAGEWFETAHTTVNDKPSEFSKMDEYEDVLGAKRIDDDNSIHSVDLDKRGLASLYKSIDSNFYKPTIDDIFSKHDIAMRDVSTHSLVDLESIDFSIDSKGKVVQSRHGTGQSSPALSYREVDTTKPIAKYNQEGMLISLTGPLQSAREQGIGQIEDPLQSKVENNVMAEQIDNVTKPKVSMIDDNTEADNMATDDLIESGIHVNNIEEMIDENQDFTDKDLKLDDIGEIEDKDSKESQDRDINNTEDILSTKLADESKTRQIVDDENLRKIEARISRSISAEKLSRISEEDNLEAATSKLSTLVESNVDGSVFLDKLSDSKLSSHKTASLKENKEIELNIDNNLLETATPESVEVDKALKYSPDEMSKFDQQRHSKLSIGNKKEHFEPVRSARSSRDLQRNIDMQNMDKKTVITSQEFLNKLNSIAEENEAVSSDTHDSNTVKEKSMMNIDKDKLYSTLQSAVNIDNTKTLVTGDDINTNNEENIGDSKTIELIDKSKRYSKIKEEAADITDRKTENDKHMENNKSEVEDTTDKKSNDSLDVEENTLRIRDSAEITKTKLDVRKINKSEIDEKHISKEELNIQIKRKSQVRQEENKPLTIKSSDEIIESKQDDKEHRDSQTKHDEDKTNKDNQKEQSEKEDKEKKEKEDNERDLKSDDESSQNADKPERHSGDDHLKQD